MLEPTTRQLLRRHATAFAIAFASLTALLLVNYARKQVPAMSANGAPTGTIVEMLLLAVPFTVAMTIPFAVFVAVLWVFTRLGASGVLDAARREPRGVRRLIAPVIWAAAAVAALTFVSNAWIVPRSNERLAAIFARGGSGERGDREMTIGELWGAALSARADDGPDASARAVPYEVELHKKVAVSASPVILALAAIGVALIFPLGGVVLVIGAAYMGFSTYYVGLIAGETLAERLVVPPFVAMWMANALFLAIGLAGVWWRSRQPRAPRGVESLESPTREPRAGATLPLRIAGALCAVVGLLGVGGSLYLAREVVLTTQVWIALGVTAGTGLLMCLAAVWVWKRRRRGLIALAAAWPLSAVVGLIAGAQVKPPGMLMVFTLIVVVSNRHQLR